LAFGREAALCLCREGSNPPVEVGQTTGLRDYGISMRYAVVIEKGERNYSAYVPDLPGCVSVGDTLEEVKAEIREAIEFHLEGMREDGLPIPKPSSQAEYVEVGEPAA
jgi:predicted RNase H-like HicB family nuclease